MLGTVRTRCQSPTELDNETPALMVSLLCGTHRFRWTSLDQPLLMGIVNVTPDSFSDGGQFSTVDAAVTHALRLVDEGADWLDIGGESTRPGAEPVPLDEERRRVLPVLETLAKKTNVPLSIDTYKPALAAEAVAAGASIINDITGFCDDAMIAVAANCQAACVVMHMRGTPQTMMELAEYNDVMDELDRTFRERIDRLVRAGVERERLILDPGIGFAKRRRHNLQIMQHLPRLRVHRLPVLVGASRKSILGDLTGRTVDDRLAGTIASSIWSAFCGMHILRVHDVRSVRDALAVWRACRQTAD